MTEDSMSSIVTTSVLNFTCTVPGSKRVALFEVASGSAGCRGSSGYGIPTKWQVPRQHVEHLDYTPPNRHK
eukprot:5423988-Amphidinium_carterae.1